MPNKQLLVPVLRIDQQKGVRRQSVTCRTERDARFLPAFDPQVDGRIFLPGRHDLVGNIKLAVEFQRSRLNPHGPGCGARTRVLIYDPNFQAFLDQPQGKNQSGVSGAYDQNIMTFHNAIMVTAYNGSYSATVSNYGFVMSSDVRRVGREC